MCNDQQVSLVSELLGFCCSAYLKKAIRDIDRSSFAVRDDAKMLLSTAGVTGMRPFGEGGESGTPAYERFSSPEETEDAGMEALWRIHYNNLRQSGNSCEASGP